MIGNAVSENIIASIVQCHSCKGKLLDSSAENIKPIVQCPGCKAKLFDGKVVKGISILKLAPSASEGLCKRCKTWVRLPIIYNAGSPVTSLDKSI